MANGSDRDGIKFYYEWEDQIEALPEELQLEVIKAIWHYDRLGEKPNTENPILRVLLDKYYVEVDIQQEKWEKKAGRPATYPLSDFIPLFEANLTDKQIAEKLGCSTKTVSRKRKEQAENEKKEKENKIKESKAVLCPMSGQETKVLSNPQQSSTKSLEEQLKEYGF